ncbi:MAG: 3-dehydroquinate synthase [Desulfotalea sp.]
MAILEVGLGDRSYPIRIEAGCLDTIGEYLNANPVGNRYAIITDEYVKSLYGDRLTKSLDSYNIAHEVFTFKRGEASKCIEVFANLSSALAESRFDRKDAIIALGGGVCGDLAGFIASSYMRGIPFVQVPTTLLSQVDSSVGGKTGIDIPQGKNLIGAFYQPKAVFIDPNVLSTLDKDELLGGLAEVIKYGIIWDKNFFTFLKNNRKNILALDPTIIERTITKCCAIKAEVVAKDEKEGGLRRILNFGHTIGHAVETESGYGLIHGLAVSIGMVAAGKLSNIEGYLSLEGLGEIIDILNDYQMPISIPSNYDLGKIKQLLFVDKKVESGRLVFVLCDEIGHYHISDEVSEENIDKVLSDMAIVT